MSDNETRIDDAFDIDTIDLNLLKLLADQPMYKAEAAEGFSVSVQTVGRRIDKLYGNGLLDRTQKLDAGRHDDRILRLYETSEKGFEVIQWKMRQLEEESQELQQQIEALQSEKQTLAQVVS